MKYSNISAQEFDSWLMGVGVNVVDNSGSRFDELLNIEENWNVSKLLKMTLERRFEYDFGAVLAFSLNEFTIGKKINGELINEDVNYFAVDIMLKNYISNYWKDPKKTKSDQYVLIGWGGNFFDWVINNTVNIGLGLNIKIGVFTWIDFHTIGKFSIDDNTAGNANHLQHSLSVVFKI